MGLWEFRVASPGQGLQLMSHLARRQVLLLQSQPNLNTNWQKCRVFAADPANGLFGFPIASPSQGLELMGHWARFLIASSEQLIHLIGYICGSLC